MPDIQQALLDFDSTIKAKPNLTNQELMAKFPEFNNDPKLLQSAHDYSATLNSGKYDSHMEMNAKFPEFFSMATPGGIPIPKQKEQTVVSSQQSVQPFSNDEAKKAIYGNIPGTTKIGDVSVLPIGGNYQNTKNKAAIQALPSEKEVAVPTQSVYGDTPQVKTPTITYDPKQDAIDEQNQRELNAPAFSNDNIKHLWKVFSGTSAGMFSSIGKGVNNIASLILENDPYTVHDAEFEKLKGNITKSNKDLSDWQTKSAPKLAGTFGESIVSAAPMVGLVGADLLSGGSLTPATVSAFGLMGSGEGLQAIDDYSQQTGKKFSEAQRQAASVGYILAYTLPIGKYLEKFIPKGAGKYIMSKVLTSNPELMVKAGADIIETAAKQSPSLAQSIINTSMKSAIHGVGTMEAIDLVKMATDKAVMDKGVSMDEFTHRIAKNAESGLVFGLATMPFATYTGIKGNQARRNAQGEVTFSVDDKGKSVEILPSKEGKVKGMRPDGSIVDVTQSMLDNSVTMTTQHFNEVVKGFKEKGAGTKEVLGDNFERDVFEKRLIQSLKKVATSHGNITTAKDADGNNIYVQGKNENGELVGIDSYGEHAIIPEGTETFTQNIRDIHTSIMNEYDKQSKTGDVADNGDGNQPALEATQPQKPDPETILQNATEDAKSFVGSITHAESGNVIEARLRGVEQPINITKGNIVQKEDGSVDLENSDKTFFYKTTDGRLHVGNIEFIEGNPSIVPAQEAIDKSLQPVREQLENDNAPEYGIGNKVVITDNTDPQNPTNAIVQIAGRNEDGTYRVQRDLGNGQVQPGIVQPREILPQFAGVLDSSTAAVDYIDPETRETRTGFLELDTPDKQMMFANGYATIDGKQIGFENVTPKSPEGDLNTKDNETNGLQATEANDTQAELGQGGDGTGIQEGTDDQAQAAAEQQIIPADEKGNLLFEQARPELTIQFLNENFEKEEIIPTVEARINSINKEITKQETFKPSGNIQKDALAKQAKRQALNALNEQLGYWKDIQEQVTPQNYKSQNETVDQRNVRWGEPVNLREMIIRKFISGTKLRWADETSESGAVISRGLGGEYRYGNDERKAHFNFISSNGVTPEQLAHSIWQANAYAPGQFEDMPLYGMDTQEILNEILDVMNSYRSIGSMIESVDEIRDQYTQQEQAYIDSLVNDEENQKNVLSILENEPDNSIFAQLSGIIDLTEEQQTELQNLQNDVTNTGTRETVIGSDNADGSIQQGEAITGNEPTVTGRAVYEGGNQSGDRGVETANQSVVNSQQSDPQPPNGGLSQAQLDTEELDAYIAEQDHNINPTEKQKETGIYPKARVSLQGHNITIETLKGTNRSGIDEGGQKWSVTMQNHYGELDGTVGYDNDPIDVFVGPNPKQGGIFVVDQISPNGSFDESKVMLGFDSADEAKAAYMSNYSEGWDGFKSITPSGDNFKEWLYDGKKQKKPFAEYKDTPEAVISEQSSVNSEESSPNLETLQQGNEAKLSEIQNNISDNKVIDENKNGESLQKSKPTLSERYDNATTPEEKHQVAVELVTELENTLRVGTTPAKVFKSTDEFLTHYKGIVSADDYKEAMSFLARGQQIAAIRMGKELLINVEHNPDAAELADSYVHETAHKAFDIAFKGEDLSTLEIPNVEKYIPSVYWDRSNAVKATEVASHQIADLLKIYSPEQIKNGEIDLSLLDEDVQYLVSKTLNKITNGKINVIGQERFNNELKRVPGSSSRIQPDGNGQPDSNATTEVSKPDNGNTGTEREKLLKEKLEKLRSKLGLEKPEFKITFPATINIDGVERSTLNSNGKPIHSTEEGIRNFWKWFGDSKVVDESGRPLVVYHGAMGQVMPKDTFKGYVSYFTDSKQYAQTFGIPINREVMSAYLKLEKPYIAPSKIADVPKEIHDTDEFTNPRIIKSETDKFDGVIGEDAGQNNGKTFVVFEPTQIKSSENNDGGFDGNNPNINFKRLDPQVTELALDVTEMLFEDGDVSFQDYSARMIDALGEGIKPYLKGFYELSRASIPTEGMTDGVQVAQFDINNFNHKEYVSNRSGRGQQNSTPTNEVPGDAKLISVDGSGSGSVGNGIKKSGGKTSRQPSGKSRSDLQPSLFGEQSDNELLPTASAVEKPTTGDTDGRGNGIDSPEGHTIVGGTSESGNKADTGLPETFKQRTARKIIEQRNAESIPVTLMDEANIRETLPLLLPEQQDDVLKAENRFFGEQHKTKEAAFGKGMLFTNGTGTGKTYTGLGVAKRFDKQGKKNILIVVPSEAKIGDWVKDGENIGLSITPLTSTKDAGQNAVITTYANFRANNALKERDFDLVMYDESHRLMEEKGGATSSTTTSHYAHSNTSEWQAFNRINSIDPTYQKLQSMGEERQWKGEPTAAETKLKEKYNTEVKPVIEQRAKKAYENTKVVFLSATPFKGHFNLRYANGSLFDWGNETTYASASRGMSRVNPEAQFFLDNFGSAYEWKFHRLQTKQKANAEAIAMQEIEFSERLMKQGAMSGRAIESDKDYSREFPLVALDKAKVFNQALNEIYSDEFGGLSEAAHNVFSDYNYTTKLFESLKASMSISRIQDHLKLGRKVIIFHRRKQANVLPPFMSILDQTRELAQTMAYDMQQMEDGEAKSKVSDTIDLMYEHANKFENKYADLLKYEQTLNYDPAINQINEAYPGQVVSMNGDTPKKDKSKNVALFNDDNSGKNIFIVQEEAGKEGISLHDTTGKHQRVLISLSLPISSTTALQIEGRPYRIGNESDAIFEYPLLGLDQEIADFGQKINKKLSTTENLAIGNQARDLLRSFAEGVLFNSGTDAPNTNQGKGGKEYDKKAQETLSEFRKAVLVYNTNQKVRGSRDSREGTDYYATPEPVGQKMVEWLGLQAGESALEPSAGHGAIAMWFPEKASVTVVEPSYSLFSKLNARSGGGNRKMLNDVFENLNVVNKFEGIAMNPPFGSGGKTAIDHVTKAFDHLRNNGRIVAIIPQGQADGRLDKFLEATPDAHLIASVKLPSSTFEQAGTKVGTRIVVIDRIDMPSKGQLYKDINAAEVKNIVSGNQSGFMTNEEREVELQKRLNEFRNELPRTQNMDLSYAENVDELFNEIEDLSVAPRQNAQENPSASLVPLERGQSEGEVFAENTTEGKLLPVEDFVHTQTGQQLYNVKINGRSDDYTAMSDVAKKYNPFNAGRPWNKFSKGFLFADRNDAVKFKNEVDAVKPEFKLISKLPETLNIDGKERSTLDSNEKPIHSTEEGIRNFYKWFGDSKVVDESGRPLVVYHGTNANFTEFKIMDSDIFGSKLGHWFTPDNNIAGVFSGNGKIITSYLKANNLKEINGNVFDRFGEDGITFTGSDAKLRKNAPKEQIQAIDQLISRPDFKAMREKFTSEGYDGLILENISKGGKIVKTPQYVVFNSTQIKSAIENNGDFDENNPNINYKIIEPEKPEFSSDKSLHQYAKEINAYNEKIKAIENRKKELKKQHDDKTIDSMDFVQKAQRLNLEKADLETKLKRIEAGTSEPGDFETSTPAVTDIEKKGDKYKTTPEYYKQVQSLDELAGIEKPVHDKKGGELISDYYKRVKAWSVANNPQAWGEQDRQEVAEFIAGITPESYEAKAQKAQAAAQAAGATVVDEPKPVFQQDGHTTEDTSAFARRVVAWREQRFINGIVRAEREAEAIEAAERGETPIDHEIARMELDMQLRTVYDSLGNLIGKQRAKKLERWAGNKEMWADNLLPVKTFLDFMRSKGMKIPDIDDYYMQATALQGKNDTGFNDYVRRYQKPVNKWIHDTIKKTGFNYRDIENYVFLKHGVERNEFFKKDGKRSKADYAGVYAIASELYAKDNGIPFDPKEKNEIGKVLKHYSENNGITLKETSEAGIYDELFANKKDVIEQAAVEKNRAYFDKIVNDSINDFESESNGKGRSIDDFWEKMNAANDFSLDTMADGGIITRTKADEIKSRYNYFVPLRGHEVEAEKMYEYSPDAGVFFSNPAIKAHGRITRAENPFSYIAQMAQSAVVMKNKNDLNKTLLRLARRDKTGMFSVNKTWYIKTGSDAEGNDIWEQAELEAKPSDELNRAEWEAWNERMKELEKEGRAKQFTKGVDLDGLFIKKKQKKQHAITIIENGEEYQVYINANPRISRAVNGLNRSEQDRVLRFLSSIKGMIGLNVTSRNPAFMAANFSRDTIFASSILPAKEGGVYAAKYISNIPVAAKELVQYQINPDTAPQYVREFFENGGETGFSHLFELQDMQKEIDKAVKPGMTVGKAWEALMMPIDVVNKIVENTTRMAVYKTSRESGRTVERSISDAKEVSLNFNRKGAGGGITDYVRSAYLFVNASVQALNNFSKVYKEHPVKMTGVVMGYIMSGLLMSLINALVGSDDEYWNLPDYDRQNNLCIWTGNGFAKIPLPQELRVFHRMGDNVAAYLWNKKPIGKAMIDAGAGLIDLIPANPSGPITASWAEAMPDAIKPLMQIQANKSFTGAAIAKDPAFMKEGVPQWRQVRTNRANEPKSPAGIIWLSAELNAALGGDKYRSAGEFEKVVLNPDKLNHLARGYFGGVYTTATQGLGTITDRFYMNDKDLNEKTTGSGLQNAYNKIDEAEQRVNQFNTIVNDLKENKIDRVQFAKDTVGTNFGAAKKIQKLGSRLRDINKTLKENQDFPEEEKNQLREAQKTILKLIEETPLRQAQ